MEQGLSIALSFQEVEKQEKFNESFYTRLENSVMLVSRSPGRTTAMTVVLGFQLTRTQRASCVISTVNIRTIMASQ